MQSHSHGLGQIVSNNAGGVTGLQREVSKAGYGAEATGIYGGGDSQNLQPYVITFTIIKT